MFGGERDGCLWGVCWWVRKISLVDYDRNDVVEERSEKLVRRERWMKVIIGPPINPKV